MTGMPEAKQRQSSCNAVGELQVGDLVAMRIPKARKAALDQRDQLHAAARQASTLTEARSLAAEAKKKLGSAIKVYDNIDELEQMQPQVLAQMEAQSKFNDMVRQGNVPGSPLTTQNI